MVQPETILAVVDNSGARRVKCIKILGGSRRHRAKLGDRIKCSVQDVNPDSQIKKGDVVDAIVVRMRRTTRRQNGDQIRFDTNSCVIVNADGNPRGTRVFGPCARELREKGFLKICSLAPEVI